MRAFLGASQFPPQLPHGLKLILPFPEKGRAGLKDPDCFQSLDRGLIQAAVRKRGLLQGFGRFLRTPDRDPADDQGDADAGQGDPGQNRGQKIGGRHKEQGKRGIQNRIQGLGIMALLHELHAVQHFLNPGPGDLIQGLIPGPSQDGQGLPGDFVVGSLIHRLGHLGPDNPKPKLEEDGQDHARGQGDERAVKPVADVAVQDLDDVQGQGQGEQGYKKRGRQDFNGRQRVAEEAAQEFFHATKRMFKYTCRKYRLLIYTGGYTV